MWEININKEQIRDSRFLLSNMVAASHIWLFKLKVINMKRNKIKISVPPLHAFQALNSHLWPVATILDTEHFPSLPSSFAQC